MDLYNAQVNKAFGDKAKEVVINRMNELGLSGEALQHLAETSPKAALQMLGVTADSSGGAAGLSSGSSVNTEALFGDASKGNGERQNFAFFQNMRRELGAAYYEPHIQKQVFEARKKLGDAFWK